MGETFKLFKRHVHAIGFALLLGVTAYGVYLAFRGETDWRVVLEHWTGKKKTVLVVLALGVAGYTIDTICWMWLYSRFKIPSWDLTGVGVCLSIHAGMFLPAQMGRLIRPDALVRLGRCSILESLKAEAALFYLDATSIFVVIVSFSFVWKMPWAIPFVAAAVGAMMVYLADRLASFLSATRVALPPDFWRNWQIFAILGLLVIGWILNGLVIYALVWDLAEGISAIETIFWAMFSQFVGSGTGSPGGMGFLEAILGPSLQRMRVPAEHLVIAIGAYRIVTFWSRLPIGWAALLLVNRRVAKTAKAKNPV